MWTIYSWNDASNTYDAIMSMAQIINSMGMGMRLAFLSFILFFFLGTSIAGHLMGKAEFNPMKIFVMFAFYLLIYTVTVNVNIASKCQPGVAYTVNNVPIGIAVPASIASYVGFTFAEIVDDTLFANDYYKRTNSCDRIPQTMFRDYFTEVSYPPFSPKLDYATSQYFRECVFPTMSNDPNKMAAVLNSNNLVETLLTDTSFTPSGIYFEFCDTAECNSYALKNCNEASGILSTMVTNKEAELNEYVSKKLGYQTSSEMLAKWGDIDSAYIQSSLSNQALLNNIAMMKLFDTQYQRYAKSLGMDGAEIAYAYASQLATELKGSLTGGIFNRIGNMVKGDAFTALAVILFPLMFFYAIIFGKFEHYLSWVTALVWISMFPVMTVIVDYFVYKSSLGLQNYFNGGLSYKGLSEGISFILSAKEYTFWNSVYGLIPFLSFFMVQGFTKVLYDMARYDRTGGAGAAAGAGGGSSDLPTRKTFSYKNDEGGITSVTGKYELPSESVTNGEIPLGRFGISQIGTTGYDPNTSTQYDKMMDSSGNVYYKNNLANKQEQAHSSAVSYRQGTMEAERLNEAFNKARESQAQYIENMTNSEDWKNAYESNRSAISSYYSGSDQQKSTSLDKAQSWATKTTDKIAEGKNWSNAEKTEFATKLSAMASLKWGTPGVVDFLGGAKAELKGSAEGSISGLQNLSEEEYLKAMEEVSKDESITKSFRETQSEIEKSGASNSLSEGNRSIYSNAKTFSEQDSATRGFSEKFANAQNVSYEDGRFVASGAETTVDLNKAIPNMSENVVSNIFSNAKDAIKNLTKHNFSDGDLQNSGIRKDVFADAMQKAIEDPHSKDAETLLNSVKAIADQNIPLSNEYDRNVIGAALSINKIGGETENVGGTNIEPNNLKNEVNKSTGNAAGLNNKNLGEIIGTGGDVKNNVERKIENSEVGTPTRVNTDISSNKGFSKDQENMYQSQGKEHADEYNKQKLENFGSINASDSAFVALRNGGKDFIADTINDAKREGLESFKSLSDGGSVAHKGAEMRINKMEAEKERQFQENLDKLSNDVMSEN